MSPTNPPGRLLGALLHVRGRIGDALRSERAQRAGWAALEGVIGFAVGLALVTLYLDHLR